MSGQAQIGPGVFIAVVGPSGVGKDTVIDLARRAFAGHDSVIFARRTITRPADAGSEDHDAMTEAAFAAAEHAGAFALSWQAHGLRYGLPVALDHAIAAGKVVVANLSRAVLGALDARYRNLVVVVISAHPDVIAQRLAARGRESEAEIAARLAREPTEDWPRHDALRIENSGPPDAAGTRLCAIIDDALALARAGLAHSA